MCLLAVSVAPKLKLGEPVEMWNHPAKTRKFNTSARRSDFSQTDENQKQVKNIEDDLNIFKSPCLPEEV